jgi:hypothetical protein
MRPLVVYVIRCKNRVSTLYVPTVAVTYSVIVFLVTRIFVILHINFMPTHAYKEILDSTFYLELFY